MTDQFDSWDNSEYGDGFRDGLRVAGDEADFRRYALRLVTRFAVTVLALAALLVYVTRSNGADPELEAARQQARLLADRFSKPEVRPTSPVWTYHDYDKAVAFAAAHDKPLVVWQGVEPKDKIEFAKALADAVHYYEAMPNRRFGRGVKVANDGNHEFWVSADNLDLIRAGKVRQIWHERGTPNPSRARVSEEVSRLYRPQPTHFQPPRYTQPPTVSGC